MNRALAILATLVLVGCQQPAEAPAATSEQIGSKTASGEDVIACGLDGDDSLSSACTVERGEEEGQLALTVRHPDGAFRRFVVQDDGSGLVPADGALGASTRYADGHAEVAIEQDRYRFPATAAE